MRITDLLRPEAIALGAEAKDKGAALSLLTDLQNRAGCLSDPARYRRDLLEREKQGTTAIGDGVAVPHAKSEAVKRPGLAAAVFPKGVDFGAPDGQPSRLFFAIAAPAGGGDTHLEILSRLMVLLMDPGFVSELLAAPDIDRFLALIDLAERKKFPEETTPEPRQGSYRVLAVTACPTGIAHTYMAAEALERAGERMGFPVKAETQGSGGAKNVLTPEEIAACDGIIIAADRAVDLSRFHGKPLLQVPVSDGISRPEGLIRRVVEGKAPVCQEGNGPSESDTGGTGAGRQVYRHLMNGVSHMLPFVIGGGILIALAFLLDAGAVNDANFADFGTITPAAAFLKNVGGVAFNFMLPILAGYIALSIADRPGLAAGFVGGALAVSGATFASPGGTDVSAGFLGALLAGFLGGYLVLGLEKLCDHLPRALEGIKPVLIYPLAGILLIGVVMCLINPFVGLINTAMTNALESLSGTSAILLGAVVAGMMAIDMGGPFNKAAYLFGTASLVSAAGGAISSPVMAAVMIGGMVPPIAIALTCTFFPNRFPDSERKNGYVNYVMGLCFITEGAIPFAAADPLRVIPSCLIGSAAAGALSMAFGCALPAPHGGIFVFPVVQNPGMYALALAAGSLIGMALLALWKRPAKKGESHGH